MCLEKLDAAFQHSWELYTLLSNRLARVDTMESTSTTLTARIKLVDWLKKREGILGISRQTNNATMVSITVVMRNVAHSPILVVFRNSQRVTMENN